MTVQVRSFMVVEEGRMSAVLGSVIVGTNKSDVRVLQYPVVDGFSKGMIRPRDRDLFTHTQQSLAQEDLFDYFGMERSFFGQSSAYNMKASKGGIDVTWFSITLQNAEMMTTVTNDMNFSVFSILFVW